MDTLAATLEEVEAVAQGDTPGEAHALVDMLVDVEALTVFETRGNAPPLVDTLANTLAQVEAAGL